MLRVKHLANFSFAFTRRAKDIRVNLPEAFSPFDCFFFRFYVDDCVAGGNRNDTEQ